MKKVRILQVITKGDWAGAQRVVYEICKYVKERENDHIEIEVALGDHGILVEKLENLGIKVFVLENLKRSINPFVDIKGYRELKKIISKQNYDVVHCHSTKAGILGRLAAHRLHVNKVLYTVHGFWPVFQYKGIKRKLATIVERFMIARTTDMVFISKSDIEISKTLGLYSSSKSRLIYNSISILAQCKATLRAELNLQNDMRIIGNLSRVDKVKNPFLFVEIAKEYFNHYRNDKAIFVWIGEGPLTHSVRALVCKYNLEDKILFIGFRDKGEEYLADFDLLFMTSIWEGVPITILEAIELKVPILASDVGGIRECIGKNHVYSLGEDSQKIITRIKSNNIPVDRTYLKMPEKYVNLYVQ